MIAPLQASDRAELNALLASHSYSSMYLRAGLHCPGDRSNFAVARHQGRIVAVAAHAASGMMLLQAPVDAGALTIAVLGRTGRRLAGFLGPMDQVQAARSAMGLADADLRKNTHEDLFALTLSALRMPDALAAGKVRCRVAVQADFDQLLAWRVAFRAAALNDAPGAQLIDTSRADVAALLPAGSLFMLESDTPLACCSFNARLPDMVQIGNVWTPPALRGQGHGRSVVAGALAIAAANGVTSAVLSTGRHNVAALAAYRGIGFELVGDYATVTLAN
ncbi:MAG: GNAT family N-acetyltransferase [Pseudomonadota bacterium]